MLMDAPCWPLSAMCWHHHPFQWVCKTYRYWHHMSATSTGCQCPQESPLPRHLLALGAWSLEFEPSLTPSLLCWFARAVIKKYHHLGVFNNRNLFSHSFGGWKSKIKGSAGLISPGASFRGCRQPPSRGVFTWSFLCVPESLVPLFCVQISSSYTDTSQIALGFILTASY